MFEILLFFITIIFSGYIFTKSNEGFLGSTHITDTTQPTINSTTQSVHPTISTVDIDSMEKIDFSVLDDLEKMKRKENSQKMQNCLSDFSGNRRDVIRDVSELMFKKKDDNTIYDKTSIHGQRYSQLSFW